MNTQDPNLVWALMLTSILRRIVEAGDQAAKGAMLVQLDNGSSAVMVSPDGWRLYRSATLVAGLAALGIPGHGSPRNN